MLNLFTSGSNFSRRSNLFSGYSPAVFIAGFLIWTIQAETGALPTRSNAKMVEITQDGNDVRQLELGKPIERELVSGKSHIYQVTLTAGQFLDVIIEQRGIDVITQLLGPDGKQIFEFDREITNRGQEKIAQVAETSGNYQLIVQPKQKTAATGRYEIRLVEVRSAVEQDRMIQEARNLGPESIKLARVGKLDEAISLAIRVVGILEKVRGPEHNEVATALQNLATIYISKADYEKAGSLFQRALAIKEKILGRDHVDVATISNNLGIVYDSKGDYEKAESNYQRALAIRENALGQEHTLVASSLTNLAGLYFSKGNYLKAEPLYQRALTIKEKTSGPEHVDVAAVLNNLAVLYNAKGDYAKAELIYQRALAISEKAFGQEHPDVARGLNNLAKLYHERGDNEKAEPLYQRALTIREKILGPNHPVVATTLNNLANLYEDKGDSVKAEPFYERALAIWEKSLGPEHQNVASSLGNLAYLYHGKGDYLKAESLFLRARTIYEKSLGPYHPYMALAFNNLAKLYAAKGDVAQAVNLQSIAVAVSERNLSLNIAVGSESQKLAYLATVSGETSRTISLHVNLAPTNPVARGLAVSLILQRKGRVLDAMTDILATLYQRAGAQDKILIDDLKKTNEQISKHVFSGPKGTSLDEHQKQIQALNERKEELEADIGRRSIEFSVQIKPVTEEAVRSAIPGDTALVEFAVYYPFNAKHSKPNEQFGSPRYIAYVLRQKGEVRWAELGEAKVIDKSVDELRLALRKLSEQKLPAIPERDVKRLARELDEKVMQPVRRLLGDARQILLSPDGKLSLVPFAALVDESGRYLAERYSLSYLTSGRDLLRLHLARSSRSDSLIVANPNYGKPQVQTLNGQTGGNDDPLAKLSFVPLLTEPEANAIKRLMPEANVLTGEKATKVAVKRAQAPRILHVATHGFFLQDDDSEGWKSRGGDSQGSPQHRGVGPDAIAGRIENPLLRAGLALAGANLWRSGEDNGILTALEVAGLDLWGTKLVVLSACDTGIGVIKNGEGVYGMRRALVLAGAESQVVSLWKVDDVATRELMEDYYSRLKRGEGRAEAMRKVQLQMLRDPRRRHPYYWASFIHSGEWANLDGKR